MRWLALIPVLLLSVVARADGIFDLARKPKQTVVLTLGEQMPTDELMARPPMLRRIGGVLGELKGTLITDLIATVDARSAPEKTGVDARRVCVVHIRGAVGDRDVAIDQQVDGEYVAAVISSTSDAPAKPSSGARKPGRALLRRTLFDQLFDKAVGYTGSFDAAEAKEPKGEVFEVAKPYQNGAFTLDTRTIHDRIGTGSYIRFDPAARVLEKETFYARLPTGYDPKRPAGVIVWVDAGPGGKPPQPFWKVLDQYGLICIGAANSGNDRGVTERLQMALDAVATAKRRWSVNPARVYVSGISGGGKMSSILMPCFPDVFAGSLPIVGLSSYENIPSGQGAMIWPAEYSRPLGKRWEAIKGHRVAAITGDKDFNHAQILKVADVLKRDKMDVRVFDIPGMSHEFPLPEAFVSHFEWVDESRRKAGEQSESESRAALAKAMEPKNPAELAEVIRRWPWSGAAWEAVEALK